MQSWYFALAGGILIGLAAAVVMMVQGRIAGISGIVGGIVERRGDAGWRIAFVAGLALAGIGAMIFAPSAVGASPRTLPVVAIAGFLVGIGTRMGGGCTSGHGVCGLGRLSPRSLVAVITFVATGMITVWLGGRL